MTIDPRFADETADVGTAILHLLDVIGTRFPELAPALHDARVTFDTRELALLVSPIRPDGSSPLLFAFRADPSDPASFGVIAVPVVVKGAYGPPAQMH